MPTIRGKRWLQRVLFLMVLCFGIYYILPMLFETYDRGIVRSLSGLTISTTRISTTPTTTTTTTTATITTTTTTTTTTTKVTTLFSKFHELSLEEPFRSRILRIREKCSKKNLSSEFEFNNKKSFKYNDTLKLVMCETPKVASTTWQILLLRLSGFKENVTNELLVKWDYNIIPNPHFNSVKIEEIWKKMNNYTTVVLTRHPFERLVSAYYDKLSNHSKYKFYRENAGRKIAVHYASGHLHGILINKKKPQSDKYITSLRSFKRLSHEEQEDVMRFVKLLRSGEVSFYQFARYLVDTYKKEGAEKLDIHWRPQAALCHPCRFDYSYVIRFDNIASESNRLLDYVQKDNATLLPQKLAFPTETKPTTSSGLVTETMKQLPEALVQELRELYKDDFLLYDYDPFLYSGS